MRNRPIRRVLGEEARAWAVICLIIIIYAGAKTWIS